LDRAAASLVHVQDANAKPSGEIHAFAEGPDHSLWMGSTAGLYRAPAGSGALQPVPALAGAALSSEIVIGLLFDYQGVLWLDTGVGGLHRMRQWTPAGAAFERISERHGRGGKPFGANLLEDNLGRIWSQMQVYDPVQDKFTDLTAADGANLGTGWFFSYTRMNDGRFLFGGSKGILVVKPELFEESAYAPPLLVSELRVNGERRAPGNPPAALVLTAKDRSFSVEFTALDYADPTRLQYAYKLENFDPDWIKAAPSMRLASYSNLEPGSYRLHIRASNRSGVWNPLEQTMAIRVEPAWWQMLWMRLLLAALLGLLLFAFVALRTRHLHRRQRELEDKVRERTTELETMALELQLNQMALEESSVKDPLTGLNNRRFLTQCIDADLALALRAHEGHLNYGEVFTDTQDLLFYLFDIDHFKSVNDSYGHLAGDEVLKQFSDRLRAVFRDADYLVRWGGEEFLCVARQTDRRNAAELAERARAAIAREPFVLADGQRIQVACSVGFSCYPLQESQPRRLGWVDMVKIADGALYCVKHGGRNGWMGVLGCAPASEAALQDGVGRPLTEWIATGMLRYAASERVSATLAGPLSPAGETARRP
ncbi:MAG: diguanylate cyclase, partial [Rhodoferax sp.]|nr:diguanylate cyclase [Rhodoferax sp.]